MLLEQASRDSHLRPSVSMDRAVQPLLSLELGRKIGDPILLLNTLSSMVAPVVDSKYNFQFR